VLGPILPRGPGIQDVREVFPATEQQPSFNLVSTALIAMIEASEVTVYEEEYSGIAVRVIRLASFDSWMMDEGEAEMSD
jgi:hypothetical protein